MSTVPGTLARSPICLSPYFFAVAGRTASAFWSENGVIDSSVKPRFSSNAFALRYASCLLDGRLVSPASSDSATPMYSGYMSRLPATSARSTIPELPMSLFSRTRKPCASSAWRYSSPRMNCSGKFFVPIVMSGPDGGFAVVSAAEPSLPPPPQPASSAATSTRAASAAVREAGRISGYGRLVVRRARGGAGVGGKGEAERAALARLALCPDPTAVLLDDPVAHGEPDPRAGVGALAVQAVEGLEDLLGLVGLHADPVVGHREPPRALDLAGADLHLGVLAVRELDGVRDQVLEHLAEVAVVGPDSRHLGYLDRRARLLDRAGEHVEDLVHDAVDRHLLAPQLAAARARVLEQAADQLARVSRGGADPVDELRRAAELLPVAGLEELHVHRDRGERRL